MSERRNSTRRNITDKQVMCTTCQFVIRKTLGQIFWSGKEITNKKITKRRKQVTNKYLF